MNQAHVDQWIDFSSMEIDANLTAWIRPRVGYSQYLPPVGYVFLLKISLCLFALEYLMKSVFLIVDFNFVK